MRKILSLMITAIFTLALFACGAQPKAGSSAGTADSTTRTVTDTWGRQVEIPAKVEKIVCLGSGAPRIAAYLDAVDMMVGSEEIDTKEKTVMRDYNSVHYDKLKALPTVGNGGGSGDNNAFPEEIVKANPDVILAAFSQEAAEELAQQTGIPVVGVRYISSNAFGGDHSIQKAMRVFAEVVGAEKRCEEVVSYIDKCIADLDARTKDVPDAQKKKAYTGAVTFNGKHGFAGTYAKFPPFMQINALNVADAGRAEGGYYEVDLEQVLGWQPDAIFLDPGSMNLVNEDYSKNPQFFQSLSAVQQGNVYTMPSYNHAGTNITYALMDAYYAGTVLFPEQFADIDIKTKSGEILKEFLGKDIYDDMAQGGLYYGKLTIGE